MARTMLDKIWDAHRVLDRPDGATLLYVDRHLVHDAVSQAFDMIDEQGVAVRRPDLMLGTADHYAATGSSAAQGRFEHQAMVSRLAQDAERWHFAAYGQGDRNQGIVHVIGPELGFTLPGAVVVCGDSHTATHGAVGALAFGIGTSEIAHVLATQTIWQRKPKCMRIAVSGKLGIGVTAKDLILSVISTIGAAGGTGYAIEYAGAAVRGLSMEERMTVCNMSIEAGARSGLVAPDDATLAWLKGRPLAPDGHLWDQAVESWQQLHSDEDAVFDREVSLDAGTIAPTVTWGTSPEDAVPITGNIPDPVSEPDLERKEALARKLEYMGLLPGQPVSGIPVDRVFIGSCTNSRIEDLRAAAEIAKLRRAVVPTYVTPGSGRVKAQAEAEGLDEIFLAAGCEWTDPGCSMCVAMNGDIVPPGARCASTSNRNFAGRQGRGSRTHLLSPAMAAAAAVTGRLTDARRL